MNATLPMSFPIYVLFLSLPFLSNKHRQYHKSAIAAPAWIIFGTCVIDLVVLWYRRNNKIGLGESTRLTEEGSNDDYRNGEDNDRVAKVVNKESKAEKEACEEPWKEEESEAKFKKAKCLQNATRNVVSMHTYAPFL